MDAAGAIRWMQAIAETMREHADELTALDAAIGDGDHGTNMRRGFDAVEEAIGEEETPGAVLVKAGRTLVSKVGGASGPLWGTALRRAGRQMGDEAEVDGLVLADALDAALLGVLELGSAQPGEKTMVDALKPAIDTFDERVKAGDAPAEAAAAAARAAQEGAEATDAMQARKGRASYLGERSVGHRDPGAASSALIVDALARTL